MKMDDMEAILASLTTMTANCVMALSQAGQLDAERSKFCASDMREIASVLDRLSGNDRPVRRAVELHSAAAILDQASRPRPSDG